MRNNFCTIASRKTYNVNGWSGLRKRKLVLRLIGIGMAMSGTVIIIHTVPVFVWYIVLAVLVLIFDFILLNA